MHYCQQAYGGKRLGETNEGGEAPYCLEDVLEAVKNSNDRMSAITFLTQDCGTCYDTFPMSKVF